MIATVIKIQKKKSRYGGFFYYCFFKSVDNQKSYYTCLYPKMRNFARWKKVMDIGTTLSNLKLVKGKDKLVDADSKFQVVEEKD